MLASLEQQLQAIRTKIQKQIDDSLNIEVAEFVKEEISHAVETEVYASGIPKVYQRRGNIGNFMGTESLGDPQEMQHSVVNGQLIVMDTALPFNRSWDRDLTEAIVHGYWDKSEWWNEPRDFIDKARDNMISSNSHVEVMKKALKVRLGNDVVK